MYVHATIKFLEDLRNTAFTSYRLISFWSGTARRRISHKEQKFEDSEENHVFEKLDESGKTKIYVEDPENSLVKNHSFQA